MHATTRWPTPPDLDCATIRLVHSDAAAHRNVSVPVFVSFVSGRHGPSTSHHRTRLRHAIWHAAPNPLAPVTTQVSLGITSAIFLGPCALAYPGADCAARPSALPTALITSALGAFNGSQAVE